jgi:hypothetical protein
MNNFSITRAFRSTQLYFRLFILIVVPLAISYAIYARKQHDFLLYGGAIAGFLDLIMILWLPLQAYRIAIETGRPVYRPPLKNLFIYAFCVFAVSILLGLIYYSLAVLFIDAWSNIRNWEALLSQRPFAIALGALTVFTVGLVFFWFRLRARFIYGISEILAGVAFAVYRLAHEVVTALPSDKTFYFALLTASVYLIVRGLDNMHHAWKDQKDPIAKLFFRLGTQSELVPIPPRRVKFGRFFKTERRRGRRY